MTCRATIRTHVGKLVAFASIVTTQRYARLTDDHVMSERLKMAGSATKCSDAA